MIEILAKSTPKETLYEHVIRCCNIMDYFKKTNWGFDKLSQVPTFYTDLFFALVLHDIGKSIESIQKMLRGEYSRRPKLRHEVISAAFIHVFDVEKSRRDAIFLAVLTHHKQLSNFISNVPKGLFDFDEFGPSAQERNFRDEWKTLLPFSDALQTYLDQMLEISNKFGIEKISFTTKIKPFIQAWANNINMFPTPFAMADHFKYREHGIYSMVLKGALQTCDHLASGHVLNPKLPYPKLYCLEAPHLNVIQKKISKVYGSAILVAPTGAGKTAASLAWAETNYITGVERLFYILPYIASNNSMYERLCKMMGDNEAIGILHGRAANYIFEKELELLSPREASAKARQNIWRSRDLYRPYKIMTLYQMVVPFFYVKGYEQRFCEFYRALIIVDEVHAYDARQIAQLLWCLKHLQTIFEARILVMTATLPSFLNRLVSITLQISENSIVRLTEEDLKNRARHQVFIRKDSLENYLNEIYSTVENGKRVLIVCNTVASAIKLYKIIKEEFRKSNLEGKVRLIHSRFSNCDRKRIESQLGNECVLIGTQAIEVSIDLSYDMMYSEPAPIDALLQRMGRVNRKGENGLAPVYICEKEMAGGPYPINLIHRTLEVLNEVEILNENLVQQLVDQVYGDGFDEEQQLKYDITMENLEWSFGQLVVGHDDESKYLRAEIDGMKVVPSYYKALWQNAILERLPLEAAKYEIPIQCKQFFRLEKKGLLELLEYGTVVNIPYHPDIGLEFQKKETDD